jgi:hypothetical protein
LALLGVHGPRHGGVAGLWLCGCRALPQFRHELDAPHLGQRPRGGAALSDCPAGLRPGEIDLLL